MALQVEVLQETFQQIEENTDEFAISFYENLFHDYPQIQPDFGRSFCSDISNNVIWCRENRLTYWYFYQLMS